jgi:hypothetical protein
MQMVCRYHSAAPREKARGTRMARIRRMDADQNQPGRDSDLFGLTRVDPRDPRHPGPAPSSALASAFFS